MHCRSRPLSILQAVQLCHAAASPLATITKHDRTSSVTAHVRGLFILCTGTLGVESDRKQLCHAAETDTSQLIRKHLALQAKHSRVASSRCPKPLEGYSIDSYCQLRCFARNECQQKSGNSMETSRHDRMFRYRQCCCCSTAAVALLQLGTVAHEVGVSRTGTQNRYTRGQQPAATRLDMLAAHISSSNSVINPVTGLKASAVHAENDVSRLAPALWF